MGNEIALCLQDRNMATHVGGRRFKFAVQGRRSARSRLSAQTFSHFLKFLPTPRAPSVAFALVPAPWADAGGEMRVC